MVIVIDSESVVLLIVITLFTAVVPFALNVPVKVYVPSRLPVKFVDDGEKLPVADAVKVLPVVRPVITIV